VALQYKSQNKLAGKKVPSANNPKSKHHHSFISQTAKKKTKKAKAKQTVNSIFFSL